MSVAQGPCSAILPTVHGCHYAFQKFPFFVSPCIIYFIIIIIIIIVNIHQLVNKFPTCYGNRRFTTVFTTAGHLFLS